MVVGEFFLNWNCFPVSASPLGRTLSSTLRLDPTLPLSRDVCTVMCLRGRGVLATEGARMVVL